MNISFKAFNPQNLLKTSYLLMALMMLFTWSCSQDNDEVIVEEQGQNILQIIDVYESEANSSDQNARRNGNNKIKFKTLKVALAQTGLAGTVSSNELTVFAPTDAAFAELGINQQNVADVPNITNILLYHVLGGEVFSTDLTNGYVTTLNGASAQINLDNGVFVNNSEVIAADIEARNGVIHAIDKVLLPPTINDFTTFSSDFSILNKALERTGLNTAVDGEDAFTVFAPVNSAFEAIDITEDNVEGLDVDFLANVLLYHVVSGEVLSSDLVNGFVPTLNGAAVEISLDGGVFVNSAEVVVADVIATNGVVHAINEVLLPPSQTIFQIADSMDAFTILVQALELTGLDAAVMGTDQLTVFAPVNTAFEALGITDENIMDQDVAFITNVLTYHVVPGRVYSSDLTTGAVETLNGSFNLDLSAGTITGNGGSISTLVGPLNVQATNGVIHVIDTVILP